MVTARELVVLSSSFSSPSMSVRRAPLFAWSCESREIHSLQCRRRERNIHKSCGQRELNPGGWRERRASYLCAFAPSVLIFHVSLTVHLTLLTCAHPHQKYQQYGISLLHFRKLLRKFGLQRHCQTSPRRGHLASLTGERDVAFHM